MSKSSTATAPKIPLPNKSAWAKGPPPNNPSSPSPRSQSPAPTNATNSTHVRRPSTLGPGVPIKDGVSVPRSNVGAAKGSSPVTFGSIDDASASISSSPAATPAVKSDGVKSFGSVPATFGHVNGKSSVSSSSKPSLTSSASTSAASTPPVTTPSTPSKPAMDKDAIRKLFQNPGSSSPSPSQPAADSSSPSIRPINLPPQQHPPSQHQPGQPSPQPMQASQFGSHPFVPFVPGGTRPPQNPGPGAGPGPGPRSPVYSRQMPNGNGARPPGGPNGPGGPPQMSGMPSPRLGPIPHPGQPSGLPPTQPQVPVQGAWPGYYYQPDYNMAYSQWGYMPQPLPHQMQHPHQHPPPPNQPGPPHGMHMSPRNPPIPLQPSTPTQAHAVPSSIHSPLPSTSHSYSNSISGLSSPPPTPSTVNARLNTNANAFVPGRPSSKIVIKTGDGVELSLDKLKKQAPAPVTPVTPAAGSGFESGSHRKSFVRLESVEDRRKRLAEEGKEKERLKAEAEEKERKEKEEKTRVEAEEKRKKEEEEEKEKERVRKEEEEKERIRREEEEEKERIRREEEEEQERVRKAKEAEVAEAKRKAEEAAAEEERVKKAAEEAERLKAEEEEKERLRLEEESSAKVEPESEESKETTETEPEDGEVEEKEATTEEADDRASELKEEAEDKVNDKDSLRINTTVPPADVPRKQRPGRLDLSYANNSNITAPLPSALATARIIDDLNKVTYPEGVKSPKVELNVNAKDGKFRYDRDFLLQFMEICKEKPDMLPPLDAIGLEPADQSSFAMGRGGSGRHRQGSGAAPPSRNQAVGLGFTPAPGFGKASAANPFMGNMGNFGTPNSTTKLSSDDRFAMASRSVSVSGGTPGAPFGRPGMMHRTSSQGGPGQVPTNRTRSKRGTDRSQAQQVGGQKGHGAFGSSSGPSGSMGQGSMMFEPVAPLEKSQNAWAPASISKKPVAVDPDSPEVVDRKVKGLLNKLTMEKFDSISDQIIAWANKSEKEKDGRTLIQVIRLVFEKATDEAAWSEMYARLCRKMMEQISGKVQDDGIKNQEGKPIAGGQLFRKYLLNRCQEDFERGWVAKEATAAAAATKSIEDQAAKAANDKSKEGEGEEIALYSDEYYAAQKAKRQGLGLIKFIGELFKLQMLTERIMHECVKKLLGNVENPEEEEIESLCKLLSTVGGILDTPKARAHMDVYFSRMKELTKSQNVSSRMQFMLQDVIELRERRWVTRNTVAAPTTIAQVHEQALKDKAAQDKESAHRQAGMSRGGSRRGGDRNGGDFQQGPDGWTVAGVPGPPRPPPKAGDLSNFGKISKAAPVTFGPSSVFSGKKEGKREPISRTSSSSNMFHMLSQNPEVAAEVAGAKPGRPASRKSSVDLSQGGAPEIAQQRKRLVLQPRSKAVEESAPAAGSDGPEEGEEEEAAEAAPAEMSEAAAKKKIDEDSKEFFGVRNLDEAEEYFSTLPAAHHFRLVDKLVSTAIESKEADAQLVADFFARAVSKELCTSAAFEEGFSPIVELLEDIAIDAPKAFEFMARMIKGADFDDERRTRIASKSGDSEKLLALLS